MQLNFSRLGGGRGRRLAGAVIAGSALVAGVGGAGLAVAGAPAGAATTGPTSTPTCPAPTVTGDIAFSGTMSNITVKIGGSNSISGVSATLCGTFDTQNLQFTIPHNEVSITPGTDMFWGFLPFPTQMSLTKDVNGTLAAGSTAGTYSTTVQMTMSDVTNILWGFPCTIGPMTVGMTTGSSGSLTGTPLTGSFVTQLQGNLVAGNFPVPAIQASSSCPSFIAGLGNLLSGFPLKSGQATASASLLLKPILPGSSS